MAIRTIKQEGRAYGPTPASIVASINGATIYSGPVDTVNSPPIPQPGENIENDLFSWEVDTSFTGDQTISITVSGSPMWLAESLANYVNRSDITIFGGCLPGDTDPLSNVTIDGDPRLPDPLMEGQNYWLIEPGQTFQATLTIVKGLDYPVWDAALTYNANAVIVYGTACYAAGQQGAPVGLVPPDNPEYWIPLPVPTWSPSINYGMYTRVMDASGTQGYMALQNVPAGTPLTNTSYWLNTYSKS